MSRAKNRFLMRTQLINESGNRIRVIANFVRTGFTTPIGKPSRTFLFQNLRIIEPNGEIKQINTSHLWVKEFDIVNPEALNNIAEDMRVVFEGCAMSYSAGFLKPKCLKGALTDIEILSVSNPSQIDLERIRVLKKQHTKKNKKRESDKNCFSAFRRLRGEDGWAKEKERLAKYGFDL